MVSRFSGPIQAYRVADRSHSIFDGTGSHLHGSRWVSEGRSVIHAAETYAGALLEILVRSNLGRVPPYYAWIKIAVPSHALVEEVHADEIPGWDLADRTVGRRYGDLWYAERRTPVLLVPSLVTHGIERNLLVNQDHPDFTAITATEARDVTWDARLFSTRSRRD